MQHTRGRRADDEHVQHFAHHVGAAYLPWRESVGPGEQRRGEPAVGCAVHGQILSRLDGKEYVVQWGTPEEAIAAGLHPGVAHGLAYMNVAPVLARPEIARSYGLQPMSFESWARKQRGRSRSN